MDYKDNEAYKLISETLYPVLMENIEIMFNTIMDIDKTEVFNYYFNYNKLFLSLNNFLSNEEDMTKDDLNSYISYIIKREIITYLYLIGINIDINIDNIKTYELLNILNFINNIVNIDPGLVIDRYNYLEDSIYSEDNDNISIFISLCDFDNDDDNYAFEIASLISTISDTFLYNILLRFKSLLSIDDVENTTIFKKLQKLISIDYDYNSIDLVKNMLDKPYEYVFEILLNSIYNSRINITKDNYPFYITAAMYLSSDYDKLDIYDIILGDENIEFIKSNFNLNKTSDIENITKKSFYLLEKIKKE